MGLKILILCAGYGTRLQRDILQDDSGKYNHLLGVPKALLPVGGKDALITHWLQILRKARIKVDTSVYVVTNAVFYESFISWANNNGVPASNIANNGTTCNEERLGAVSDIAFGLRSFQLYDSDVIIIGGDTLFKGDFNFEKLLERFMSVDNDGCFLTTYTVHDNATRKHGILTLEDLSTKDMILVTGFLEKPDPRHTTSRNACPCFYLIKRETLPLVSSFLIESQNDKAQTIENRDGPGNFLAWAINGKRVKFYAEKVGGRIDVGGLESYLEAKEYFKDLDT
ncbi:10105_t:CDS:1 [Acaulospora morrowiae]|uniref:10105_t:CDS:1 n=1 Tax=Acaulospora morrowiae TaxID=94023 RepID=A0A9N8ZAI4_9GLOM|nr:10105_t:CDS:1 [Acaulospora morrowiae]